MKEIKISSNSTLNSPQEIAEEFNDHFTNIGPNFASEIPPCDIPPKSYLIPSNTAFSLQNTSQLLKKLSAKKATVFDNIPCNLLKLAADIVAPSLTHI